MFSCKPSNTNYKPSNTPQCCTYIVDAGWNDQSTQAHIQAAQDAWTILYKAPMLDI